MKRDNVYTSGFSRTDDCWYVYEDGIAVWWTPSADKARGEAARLNRRSR